MGTYKVITNSYSGQTTVAYQCGTPVPNITADLLVSVPITKAAFTTTTYIPWIELLGMRTTIKAYTSDFSYVTSACLNQLYDEGETVSVASGWSYDNAALEALNVSVRPSARACQRAPLTCEDRQRCAGTDRKRAPRAAQLALLVSPFPFPLRFPLLLSPRSSPLTDVVPAAPVPDRPALLGGAAGRRAAVDGGRQCMGLPLVGRGLVSAAGLGVE